MAALAACSPASVSVDDSDTAATVDTPPDTGPACTDVDEPDLDNIDSNCDGIDGDLAEILFVSPTGTPFADGTREQPLSDITIALERARILGTRWVFLAAGDYTGPLTLVDGISLAGGFDPVTWQPDATGVTRFTAATSPVVVARDLTLPTVVQNVHVEAPDASAPSAPSVALHVVDSADHLTWRGGRLSAGTGGAGVPGADAVIEGDDGRPGADGENGCFIVPPATVPSCWEDRVVEGAEYDLRYRRRLGRGGRWRQERLPPRRCGAHDPRRWRNRRRVLDRRSRRGWRPWRNVARVLRAPRPDDVLRHPRQQHRRRARYARHARCSGRKRQPQRTTQRVGHVGRSTWRARR